MIKPTELNAPNKHPNPYRAKPLANTPTSPNAPSAPVAGKDGVPNLADKPPVDRVELSEAAKSDVAKSSASSESTLSKMKDKLSKSSMKDMPIPTPDIPKKAPVKVPEVEETKKPILEAEKKGHLKKPAIIFIPGMEVFSTGSSGNYNGIRKIAESVTGARLYGWDQSDEIVEQIKKLDKDQPVILVGHSFGGDTAHEVADELNTLENGFRKVDLLVTLDSIGLNNDIIPSNVKRNLNIFSEKDMWLNDGPHVAREFAKTKVTNILRQEKHTDLDDTTEVQKEILDAIGDILKGHGREKIASNLIGEEKKTEELATSEE